MHAMGSYLESLKHMETSSIKMKFNENAVVEHSIRLAATRGGDNKWLIHSEAQLTNRYFDVPESKDPYRVEGASLSETLKFFKHIETRIHEENGLSSHEARQQIAKEGLEKPKGHISNVLKYIG